MPSVSSFFGGTLFAFLGKERATVACDASAFALLFRPTSNKIALTQVLHFTAFLCSLEKYNSILAQIALLVNECIIKNKALNKRLILTVYVV